MTIEQFLESAKQVEQLAEKYIGKYVEYYNLKHLDCGNIEFEVFSFKEDELLNILPDDTRDFHTYMQFCFCNGEWRLCMSHTIRHVCEYKMAREARRRASK